MAEKIGLQAIFDTTAFKNGLKDYTNGLDEANSKTTSSGAMMGKVLGATAVAGAAAFAVIAAAALAAGVGVAKAITNMVFDAGKLGDTYSKMSLVTGISTDKLQEFAYAGKLLDVDLEAISSGMRFLTRNMYSARDGTGEVADAFKTLGVKVVGEGGNLRDANTVFGEMIDALGKIEDPTLRDALAMKTMGRSAMELNPLIKAGSERLRELMEEAHKMGAVIDSVGIEALDKFQDKWEALGLVFQSLKAQIALAFLPIFVSLENAIGSFLVKTLVPAITHFATFIEILTGLKPAMEGVTQAANTSVSAGPPAGWELKGTQGSSGAAGNTAAWWNESLGQWKYNPNSPTAWEGTGAGGGGYSMPGAGQGYGAGSAAGFVKTPFELMVERVYKYFQDIKWDVVGNKIGVFADTLIHKDWATFGDNVIQILNTFEAMFYWAVDMINKIQAAKLALDNSFMNAIPSSHGSPSNILPGNPKWGQPTIPVTPTSYAPPPSVQVLTGGHGTGVTVHLNANVSNGIDVEKLATRTAEVIARRRGSI